MTEEVIHRSIPEPVKRVALSNVPVRVMTFEIDQFPKSAFIELAPVNVRCRVVREEVSHESKPAPSNDAALGFPSDTYVPPTLSRQVEKAKLKSVTLVTFQSSSLPHSNLAAGKFWTQSVRKGRGQ
jgi:hypothetical protein